MTSAVLYGQDSLNHKNNLKISILSFADNAKIQYERVINKNYSLDLTASFYYLQPFMGLKIEPSFRYYFQHHAPAGWYMQPKISIGFFNAQEHYDRILSTFDSNNSLMNVFILDDSFNKYLKFYPIGVSLKFGIQKYFGKNKRFVFDYNLGLQFSPLYYAKPKEETEYYDTNGNRNVVDVSPSLIKVGLMGKTIYWYVLGPGSFFETNISIGYRF